MADPVREEETVCKKVLCIPFTDSYVSQDAPYIACLFPATLNTHYVSAINSSIYFTRLTFSFDCVISNPSHLTSGLDRRIIIASYETAE